MRRKLLAGAAIAAALLFTLPSAATSYVYDNLGRLWIVNYDNGVQVTYTYDSAGNRTSVVTQLGSNQPPQANNDYITVAESGSDTFDPRAVDVEPNPPGYTLSVTGVGTPSKSGSTATYTSTSVTYTPAANWTGKDSFTYSISDGHGNTEQATVFATVTNVGPVANPDNVSTAMNTALTYDPRTNDTEPNPPGYSLTISSTTTPSHGTVAINSGTTLTYTPTTGYTGNDSFSYTISDGHGLTSTATDTIAIGSPPVAVNDTVVTALNTATTYDPRVNDSDPNNLSFTITSKTTPTHGTAAINGGATITYTPTTGYSGTDTFNYTITDANGMSASATENMCIGPSVTAVNDTVGIVRNVQTSWVPQSTFDPRANDTDNCSAAFTVTSVTQPSLGSVIINTGGTSVTYTYNGTVNSTNRSVVTSDSFTYTDTDANGATSTATVTVNLNVNYTGSQ